MSAVCGYSPRNPEDSLLYAVVAAELETLLSVRRQQGHDIPEFVEHEFRAFLDCGVLARGFVRVHCDACGLDRAVGFSCKRRGFCPSCGGRRMADTAAHLVDRVLPHVPVRQWVLSVPHALRYRLAYDSRLRRRVLRIFARVVFQSLRRRARAYGIPRGQCGAVTFVQRFGSALNLHVHAHSIVLDGVYAAPVGEASRFYALKAPEDREVAWVAETIAQRTVALWKRIGADGETADAEDRLAVDEPWLTQLYAAAIRNRVASGARAGRRVETAGVEPEAGGRQRRRDPRCATVAGFSVHANVAVRAQDRERIEQLCRYAARPPLAVDRLSRLPDGRLTYRLKTPWQDGTTHVVMEASELLERLAALVPAPRVHIIHYFGVLAPAAKWRPLVVPARVDTTVCSHTEESVRAKQRRPNLTWAQLMQRVFAIDVLQCPRCLGPMRILAAIHAPEAARKILECLGLPCRAPPLAPARRNAISSKIKPSFVPYGPLCA